VFLILVFASLLTALVFHHPVGKSDAVIFGDEGG
jgi:hypothetical protein